MDVIRVKATMVFLSIDHFSRPVYRCIDNNNLYKDINCGEGEPSLYSCSNQEDGDPGFPVQSSWDVLIVSSPPKISREDKLNYSMLSMLAGRCEYYLNYGNRRKDVLSGEDEQSHIDSMKQLYSKLPVKPEWLTYEKIIEYERLMINDASKFSGVQRNSNRGT